MDTKEIELLHTAIMNIPNTLPHCWDNPGTREVYAKGHRDARHAAAELVAAHQGEAKVCHHDDIIRQGAIWTKCQQCGKRWADDEAKDAPVQATLTEDDLTQEFTLDQIVMSLTYGDECHAKGYRAELDEYIRVEINRALLAAAGSSQGQDGKDAALNNERPIFCCCKPALNSSFAACEEFCGDTAKCFKLERFYMDHGLWHDRVTGQHMWTQDQYDENYRDGLAVGRENSEHATIIKNQDLDGKRLDFMATHEAWVAWTKDGETCRVFHRTEDGDSEPMEGWSKPFHGSAREAIDAALAAKETK